MSVNFIAKNASNFIELSAAFFVVEAGRGLTGNQLISLLSKTKDIKEYELVTIEGDGVSAMGLINMQWFEQKFNYDSIKIERFVQKVINGVYTESDDNVYFFKESSIYIASPDTY